jgi:uncharacterized protein (TIGR02596 family)
MEPANIDAPTRRQSAFSLIELLVTMTLAGILLGITASSLNHGSASLQLKGAADSVVSIVAQARQMAAASNVTHELRIYRWTEDADSRLGFFIYRSSPSAEADFTGEQHVCDASTQIWPTLSSLFSGTPPEQTGQPPAKGHLISNSRYIAIQVHPSGRTNLPSPPVEGNEAHLSLTTQAELWREGGPKNFVTLVIDHRNATTRLFTPAL